MKQIFNLIASQFEAIRGANCFNIFGNARIGRIFGGIPKFCSNPLVSSCISYNTYVKPPQHGEGYMARPAKQVDCNDAKTRLLEIVRSRKEQSGLSLRAKIVLQ
jgi:hypothetical protein